MEQTDPVTYPKVRIGAQDVEVRFTCGSILKLKKEFDIDLDTLADPSKQLKGAAAIERTLKLLAAGVSHSFKGTVDELADQIDLSDFSRAAGAINESLKKALPQAQPAEASSQPTVN